MTPGSLSALLWLVMAWQQAPQDAGWVTSCVGDSTGGRCLVDGKWVELNPQPPQENTAAQCLGRDMKPASCEAVPFDIAPVAKKIEIFDLSKQSNQAYVDGFMEQCVKDTDCVVDSQTRKVYRRVHICADKSRFLLMSEDGKWHCLALHQ